jgi:hypothetical protein
MLWRAHRRCLPNPLRRGGKASSASRHPTQFLPCGDAHEPRRLSNRFRTLLPAGG